jgi:hypothetical protein
MPSRSLPFWLELKDDKLAHAIREIADEAGGTRHYLPDEPMCWIKPRTAWRAG